MTPPPATHHRPRVASAGAVLLIVLLLAALAAVLLLVAHAGVAHWVTIPVGGLGTLSGAFCGAVCLQFIFLVVGASGRTLNKRACRA